MKLTRKKITAGSYHLVAEEGTPVARADLTGSHLDNYPWSWYLLDDVEFLDPKPSTGGAAESLKAVVSLVAGRAAQFGITY